MRRERESAARLTGLARWSREREHVTEHTARHHVVDHDCVADHDHDHDHDHDRARDRELVRDEHAHEVSRLSFPQSESSASKSK
jgi:hypothetical protein